MNRNPKEKFARIDIRVKPKDKEKIKRIADKCNLPLSEYMVQRALRYEPKTVLSDVFFDFYNKLCEVCNTAEITPEEAHKIGLETAKRMWSKDYEIVVTTHLNTDNLHNHIFVNSVSFRTGRKFENHISDHYRLREISDAICLERGKSVLPPSKFTGSRKKDYWIRKNGGLTHRDILKRDIESILPYCGYMDDIERRLLSLGYQFPRNRDYKHISIIAPGWKRAIRLDSLGYTNEVLRKRIYENRNDQCFYVLRNNNPPFRPRVYPLLVLEKKLNYEITHSKNTAAVLVDVLFYTLLQLLNLTRNEQELQRRNQPLSPSIRQALTI